MEMLGRFKTEQLVSTASPEILLSIDFIERLAEAVSGLQLSRRKTPDWLADQIFGWQEHGGIIVDHHGYELFLDDDCIDAALGRDGTYSGISAMVRSAGQRRQRRPRSSLLFRLQLYDAAFKIVGRPITE